MPIFRGGETSQDLLGKADKKNEAPAWDTQVGAYLRLELEDFQIEEVVAR